MVLVRIINLISNYLRLVWINVMMIYDRLLRRKKIIVIELEETFYTPFIFPIYRSLKKKADNISYYLATNEKINQKHISFDIPHLRRFPCDLSHKLSLVNIYLSPHIFGIGPKNAVKIHVSHGHPVKFASHPEEYFLNYNYHFLIGPLHRKHVEKTIKKYRLLKERIKLVNVGYPKSDDLVNNVFNREKILHNIGLDSNIKTVIYAPSWEEGLSLRTQGENIIEEILKINNINFVVKLHPASLSTPDNKNYEFYTGGIDWRKKLIKYDKFPRFKHIITDKIDPLLIAADLMVTDISGVALEFICLDKPVIYFDCPEFFQKTIKNIYKTFGDTNPEDIKSNPISNAGRHTGLVVSKLKDLDIAIKRSLRNPREFSQKRKEFAKELRYNPGKSAEIAADKIINLLN